MDLPDPFLGNCQHVVREDDEIRELAWFDRRFKMFLEGDVGVVDGLATQRFVAGNLLARAYRPRLQRPSGDGEVDIQEGMFGAPGQSLPPETIRPSSSSSRIGTARFRTLWAPALSMPSAPA